MAQALVSAVEEQGGKIKLGTEPKRILIENGKAVGIETAEGDIYRARHFVVSGLNPQQTFLELMDESFVPKEWRIKARDFQYNLIAPLFALNLNLNAPPTYEAARNNPDLNKALMVILGLEHFRQYPEIVDHHEKGTIPPTVMWGSCPTVFDPSQAPPGKHTAFMWEKLPYRLKGSASNWDAEKESHGKKMFRLWSKYAPNLERDVIDWFTRTALDTERTFPNMKNGDLLVGAFTNGQIGYHRPFDGAGHYRGHVKGLYLCGSACHPGGNITGLPGYNCAQVIFSDLNLSATWAPESAEQYLKKLC